MKQVRAVDLMGYGQQRSRELTPEQQQELLRCKTSFFAFVPYWRFRNRETGEVSSFASLWPGQQDFAELMMRQKWIFALKAGKLGFTELECAYDAWVLRFGPRNARVHVFSKDHPASQELVRYIRFGLKHLPHWMQLPVSDEAGSDSTTSLKLNAGWDDTRTLRSYAASPNAAIDQSATHVHVDELSHMQFARELWYAIETSVAPGGSLHIVTRGAGDDVFSAELWRTAEAGTSRLVPFFAPWYARPDRDRQWREEQSGTLHQHYLLRFAPETAEDALAGDETAEYIPMEIWDQCHDENLPKLLPGDRTPLVMGVDAAVTGDQFAIVLVSRHPQDRSRVAIRACKVWSPADFGGRIDFHHVERFIFWLLRGGCPKEHPQVAPEQGCYDCHRQHFPYPGFNIRQIAYDPYQMESMVQRLNSIVWCRPFNQGTDRLRADAGMASLALRGYLVHNGSSAMREHVQNARAKLQPDEDSKLRIVKRAPDKKIDLVVAASMAVHEAMRLNL